MDQGAAPYTGPDRRATRVDPRRVEAIEERQAAMLQELARNTEITNRVVEILEAPATFWAWCSKWGRRVSLFAKFAAPVIALLVAVDQFLHIDIGGAIMKVFNK